MDYTTDRWLLKYICTSMYKYICNIHAQLQYLSCPSYTSPSLHRAVVAATKKSVVHLNIWSDERHPS